MANEEFAMLFDSLNHHGMYIFLSYVKSLLFFVWNDLSCRHQSMKANVTLLVDR